MMYLLVSVRKSIILQLKNQAAFFLFDRYPKQFSQCFWFAKEASAFPTPSGYATEKAPWQKKTSTSVGTKPARYRTFLQLCWPQPGSLQPWISQPGHTCSLVLGLPVGKQLPALSGSPGLQQCNSLTITAVSLQPRGKCSSTDQMDLLLIKHISLSAWAYCACPKCLFATGCTRSESTVSSCLRPTLPA